MLTWWTATLVGGVALAVASHGPLPPAIQAALFKKVFHYDEPLKNKTAAELTVLVLPGRDEAAAAMLVQAFMGLGLSAQVTTGEAVAATLTKGTVVYFSEGSLSKKVQDACVEKGVLTISGLGEYARRGDVSIAVGLEGKGGGKGGGKGRPQLIVHLPRLQAERHALHGWVLGLAEVIK